jgi:hypothetical protein
MPEMILPGTYIEVRSEGLLTPGQITVGNIGIVGTAARGPLGTPTLLGSYDDAIAHFGGYDPFLDASSVPPKPRADSLTLTRALELAFGFGATTVYAVRIGSGAKTATYLIPSKTGSVALTATTEGTWGNGLGVNVAPATDDVYVIGEKYLGSALPVTLKNVPKISARNRVTVFFDATATSQPLEIVASGVPAPGQVTIDPATRQLKFGDVIKAADKIDVSYVVGASLAVVVTLRYKRALETYAVLDNESLAQAINANSALVSAGAVTVPAELPTVSPGKATDPPVFAAFAKGDDGAAASASDYQTGLDALLNQPVQIVLAAGQTDVKLGNILDKHCQKASTDAFKGDRIGIIGPDQAVPTKLDAYFDSVIGHNFDSDRIIFVAPGIVAADSASGAKVTLPGAYAAAAFAGFLSSLPAHVSSTNKTLPIDGLEVDYDDTHLTQLVQNRILALERRRGFHVVKGITTTTGAFKQITTRRIVDFAKYGVRSAADPYVGLLNNKRVRSALDTTLTSFLTGMIQDEMLESFSLDVSATRAEEIKGIVNVTMVLVPVFSIDFIKVTMVLQ